MVWYVLVGRVCGRICNIVGMSQMGVIGERVLHGDKRERKG